MTRFRSVVLVLALALPLAACGDDNGGGTKPTTTTTTTTTTTSTTTTTTPATLPQPAIWPAAGTTFSSPEEVARDFVTHAIGVPPVLGQFRQGDSRSGEIDVLSPGENGTQKIVRSTLLVRQLGAADGWYVLAAANDHATITTPASGATVPAAPLAVSGVGRGFEGALSVTAFQAGRADVELAKQLTQGGSMADAAPYQVTLDLSAAKPGEMVTLLVRGGTGLETDPGDFGAVPVVIGS